MRNVATIHATTSNALASWLFIIEGAITMFVDVISVFILPDCPHDSRGFSADERKLAVLRMTEDAGESDSDDRSACKAFLGAMLDYRTHVMALTLTAMVVSLLARLSDRSMLTALIAGRSDSINSSPR